MSGPTVPADPRERLRIALLAHVRHPIKPPFSGGMEAHSWHLARGLLARGHEVTVMGSGDSDPSLPLAPITPRHYDVDLPWERYTGTKTLVRHLRDVFKSAEDVVHSGAFDVVHNNTLHHRPHYAALIGGMAMVTSLHVPAFHRIGAAVRRCVAPWMPLTMTSATQAVGWERHTRAAPVSRDVRVVHNGLDLDAWPFASSGNGEAVWAGRITHNKGPGYAIAAAREAGLRLTLFGVREETHCWETAVAPYLSDTIRYGGNLKGEELAAEIGRASLLFFTPMWDEPFGLVAIEALACGVPIAAFDNGAAREVIGDCGRFAQGADVPGLARAACEAMAIPRARCRARAEALFSMDAMLDGYEAVYRAAIANRPTRPPLSPGAVRSFAPRSLRWPVRGPNSHRTGAPADG